MRHFNSNRVYWAICLLLGAGAAFNAKKFVLVRNALAAAPSTPSPYTVKLRQMVTESGTGTRRDPEATLTIAVRSDGSRAIVNTKRYPAGDEVSRVVEFASGGRVEVGDLWDIKTTWRSKAEPSQARWRRDPRYNCLMSLSGERFTSTPETFLGEKILTGHRTGMIQRGSSTEWYALDAGCALIGGKHDFGASVNEQSLVSLVTGEPDPALFHVPASFREVPPSEYLKTMMDHLKLTCTARCLQRAVEQDKHYRQNNSL